MTDGESVEIDVDELMAKVRAEVRRRNSLEDELAPPSATAAVSSALSSPVPENSDPGRSPEVLSSQPDGAGYHAEDFLQYHDVDFVEKAYLGILGRDPDAADYSHYLEELRQGSMTKVEILGCLRYSPEGKARKVVIKGLLAPYLAHRSFKVPVLGYFIRLLTGLLKLPTIIRNFQRLDVTIPYQFESLKRQLEEVHQLRAQMESLGVRIGQLSASFRSQVDEIRHGKLVDLAHELETLRRDLEGLKASMSHKADHKDVGL